MSNNKATKKNNDIFTKHHSNHKFFLNNKEVVKPIENSFRRTFGDNLRQNVSNNFERVSSANKVFKLTNEYNFYLRIYNLEKFKKL